MGSVPAVAVHLSWSEELKVMAHLDHLRGRVAYVGERNNFKIFLRTRKIMVMHSNERGESNLHTLVDRVQKRSRERIDGVILVVIQITDDLAPNGRHLRVMHTFNSMTSLELRSSRVLRESFVSTKA